MREVAERLLRELIEAEATAQTGAEWNEPTAARSGYRNGRRDETVTAQTDDLEPAIPEHVTVTGGVAYVVDTPGRRSAPRAADVVGAVASAEGPAQLHGRLRGLCRQPGLVLHSGRVRSAHLRQGERVRFPQCRVQGPDEGFE